MKELIWIWQFPEDGQGPKRESEQSTEKEKTTHSVAKIVQIWGADKVQIII